MQLVTADRGQRWGTYFFGFFLFFLFCGFGLRAPRQPAGPALRPRQLICGGWASLRLISVGSVECLGTGSAGVGSRLQVTSDLDQACSSRVKLGCSSKEK